MLFKANAAWNLSRSWTNSLSVIIEINKIYMLSSSKVNSAEISKHSKKHFIGRFEMKIHWHIHRSFLFDANSEVISLLWWLKKFGNEWKQNFSYSSTILEKLSLIVDAESWIKFGKLICKTFFIKKIQKSANKIAVEIYVFNFFIQNIVMKQTENCIKFCLFTQTREMKVKLMKLSCYRERFSLKKSNNIVRVNRAKAMSSLRICW